MSPSFAKWLYGGVAASSLLVLLHGINEGDGIVQYFSVVCSSLSLVLSTAAVFATGYIEDRDSDEYAKGYLKDRNLTHDVEDMVHNYLGFPAESLVATSIFLLVYDFDQRLFAAVILAASYAIHVCFRVLYRHHSNLPKIGERDEGEE